VSDQKAKRLIIPGSAGQPLTTDASVNALARRSVKLQPSARCIHELRRIIAQRRALHI